MILFTFLFPPAYGGGEEGVSTVLRHDQKSTMAYKNTSREILMQNHFLSDAFFR
ncbi:MAG: hypothetical protein LBR79_01355 [Oscillospiraceae bacterium]|nr:hypothetical protein [Oscillospiraceae bacterium]